MRNLSLLVLILVLVGCSSYTSTSFQVAQIDIPRETTPTVSEEQIKGLAQRGNVFAAELYRYAITNSDQNLTFSPYSITQAFSILYAGAQNEIEAELVQVFYYLPQETQHETLNALDQQVTIPVSIPWGEDGTPFELIVVNTTWGQQDFSFREDFLTTLAQQYGAGIHTLDFANQPESARQTINGWVAQQTNDRIPDLLPPNSIDDLTRLVLTNAVYFKATWAEPFDKDNTQPAMFTLMDESTIDVSMMNESLMLQYMEHEVYQAARLPYIGDTVDMWIILPQEGQFAAVEEQLGGTFFSELRNQAETYEVEISLPKFNIKSTLELKSLLQLMGLNSAFDMQTADFSAIVEDYKLFVADAFHQSTIIVDEQGTEATAATGVVITLESMVQQAEMNLNRPFIFAIMDRETGALLFLGRVMNPSEGG